MKTTIHISIAQIKLIDSYQTSRQNILSLSLTHVFTQHKDPFLRYRNQYEIIQNNNFIWSVSVSRNTCVFMKLKSMPEYILSLTHTHVSISYRKYLFLRYRIQYGIMKNIILSGVFLYHEIHVSIRQEKSMPIQESLATSFISDHFVC